MISYTQNLTPLDRLRYRLRHSVTEAEARMHRDAIDEFHRTDDDQEACNFLMRMKRLGYYEYDHSASEQALRSNSCRTR